MSSAKVSLSAWTTFMRTMLPSGARTSFVGKSLGRTFGFGTDMGRSFVTKIKVIQAL